MANPFKTERRKSQALLDMEAAFVAAAGKVIVSLGGVRTEDADCYAVQTTAGRLDLSVYPDFIAGRFDDVERARGVLGSDRLNPHSGKWNFGQGLLFDTTTETRPQVEWQVLSELRRELGAIVVAGHVDPHSGRPTIAGVLRQMLRQVQADAQPHNS